MRQLRSRNNKVQAERAASGLVQLSGRKRFVLDGPFAETKELIAAGWPNPGPVRSGYAPVNGLQMYYEIHGRGRPVVLLHAALGTIDGSFGNVVRALASTRQVIAIEQQAHGRTADIARSLSYEQIADDTAEMLRQLGIPQADFFGFSMGAAAALQIAVRHPGIVRKLAVVSGGFDMSGFDQDKVRMISRIDPEQLPELHRQEFLRVGAGPAQWTAAVQRAKDTIENFRGLRRQQLRGIRADTLVVAGETGLVRRDHVDEVMRLLPRAHLKMFEGDDHDPTIVERSAAMIPGFLDAPLCVAG